MNRLRGRDWSFLGLALLVTAVCIRLAFWQLSRLQERRESNARILERLASPVVDLSADGSLTEALEYRPVIVRGIFDASHEILLKNRSYNGQPGYHLVTPLLLDASELAVLVDRGWVPVDAAQQGGRIFYRLEGEQEIVGVVRASQPEPRLEWMADKVPAAGEPPLKAWRVLNIEGIQNQIPYLLLPFYISQSEPIKAGAGNPIPDPEIDLSEGPHVGYALQWFAFAAIAVLGGFLWFRRRWTAGQPRLNGGES